MRQILENIGELIKGLRRIFSSLNDRDKVDGLDRMENAFMNAFAGPGPIKDWNANSPDRDRNHETGNDRVNVTFKVYDLLNYPNGDNRVFTLHGSHTFGDVLTRIKEKYSYMGSFIPLYRDKNEEVITVDSDEIYDRILFETFGKNTGSGPKDGEIKLYVKPLNASFAASNANKDDNCSSCSKRFYRYDLFDTRCDNCKNRTPFSRFL